MKKIFILIIIVLLTTGCQNYRELNKLAITSAIGIEKDSDNFKITIEVLETEKTNDENTPKYKTIISRGKTVQEALRNSILSSSKRLYANHLSILIIDEKLAYEGIKDIIDLFFRDPESRKQFYVLISDDIGKLLNTETPLDKVNANSIYERVKANKDFLANINVPTFSTLISKYSNPNIDIVLPKIEVIDGTIKIEKTGIFDKDKLIKYISLEETRYLNFILNNISDTILTTEDNKNYMSIEINNSKTKYKVNNKNIDININMSGNIAEINNNINLTDPKSIEYIEKIFEESLKEKIDSFVNKIAKYNTDIFGFKDLIYKYDFKNYNVDLVLSRINVNTNININLKYKGNGAYELYEK